MVSTPLAWALWVRFALLCEDGDDMKPSKLVIFTGVRKDPPFSKLRVAQPRRIVKITMRAIKIPRTLRLHGAFGRVAGILACD